VTFLFDTNVCVEFLRGRNESIRERLQGISPSDVGLSAIVVAELFLGAAKSTRPEARALIERFVGAYEVLPFGEAEARIYSEIRSDLEARGQKIGANDLLIAATAISFGLTIVTHNVSEFTRVRGLRVEDWQDNHGNG
jgi:tRNA(fMet)-specific endonuclease VapC